MTAHEPMPTRERVARAIDQADPDGPLRFNGEPDFSDFDEWDREKYFGMADAAIAALNEAGFEIVQRPTIKCSQCNDTGVIWPEHGHGPSSCIYCWIRRAEPLPPTPGPFKWED